MSMMQTYKNITKRDENKKFAIEGHEFTLMRDCKNDYHTERLPTIPAGTKIVADFAGDFGMYGMVEVNGAIHKVKVLIEELSNINFGAFDARNDHFEDLNEPDVSVAA